MPSAQDPFYVVKQEIQESIDKLKSTFHQWENTADVGERSSLSKEVLASCESIAWQSESGKQKPSYFQLHKHTLSVDELDKAISVAARDPSWYGIDEVEVENRRKWTSDARTQDNDDFIESESDRQMLLIKRQDEELDELSLSVQRIGGVGLTIHEELLAQEKIIDELGNEMDGTSNRLDFVQKKVAMVMKKASAKGQIMMILGLLAMFIFLFILVFFT
ncbi:Syntaxin-61 [Glycine soja]|nr:Syntaxin-61 [Glycine soja]